MPVTSHVLQQMDVTRILASLYMILGAIVGIGVNAYVFYMLRKSYYRSAFHIFCRSKTIANIIVLFACLFWAGPATVINKLFLPEFIHGFIGNFSLMGAYGMGPLITFCMTINRFLAVFYPLKFRTHKGHLTTTVSLTVCFGISFVLFLYGVVKGECTFQYDLETLSWLPVTECAQAANFALLYIVIILTIVSTFVNSLTFLRITRDLQIILNDSALIMRMRKNRLLLIQNFIQDLLYVIDLLGGIYAPQWLPYVWYQFLVNSALWQTHVSLDGFVMYWYNRRERNRITATTMKRAGASSGVVL